MKHRSLFLPAIFVGRALSIGGNLARLRAEDIRRITTPALNKGLDTDQKSLMVYTASPIGCHADRVSGSAGILGEQMKTSRELPTRRNLPLFFVGLEIGCI